MPSTTQTRHRLARRLRFAVPHILEAWLQAMRHNLPEAAWEGRTTLLDHLPDLLGILAAALETEDWAAAEVKNVQLARFHGRERYISGHYKLAQVIDEYAALRRVSVRALQGKRAGLGETLEVVHSFFDAAIRNAADAFESLRMGEQTHALAEERAALQDSEESRAAAEVERDRVLQRAQEQEEATQMRSNIVSMLGHDMRSPLNSASVNAQMIARSPGDPEGVVKRAQRVVAAVERIDSMIQNLLDADRLESGDPLALDIEQHDLAQMVHQTFDDLVLTHGTRFALECPTHLTGFWDLCALQRTLENLCTNAVKYGDPKTAITLRLESRSDGVVMSVHNWGDPLSPDCLAGLFKPRFRRIEEVQKVKHGWGLGLALVRAMATAHGGHAHVKSSAEHGTTFYVELPHDSRNVKHTLPPARHANAPALDSHK